MASLSSQSLEGDKHQAPESGLQTRRILVNTHRLAQFLGCCILVCLAALVVGCKILPPRESELSGVDLAAKCSNQINELRESLREIFGWPVEESYDDELDE